MRLVFLISLIGFCLPATKSTTSAFTPSVCTSCKCYRIKCARMEDITTDCKDTYRDTCASASDIVEENDCNVKCDCCLDGKCLTWSSYYCIMFRSYEFFSVIYILAISANIFLLWRAYKHFFKLYHPYDPSQFSDPTKKDHSYFKYSQSVWVRRHLESTRGVITDRKVRETVTLFSKIEDLKPLAARNLLIWLAMVALYLIITILDLYVLFFLLDQPYSYGYLSWIQHALHIGFYVFVILGSSKFKSYSKVINTLIDEFEEETSCKVRIVKKLKLFEINWNPILTEVKGKKGKETSKLLKSKENNSFEEIDTEKDKILKLGVKEGKNGFISSRVAPL